jgi:tape measure domain-containing protein
MATAKKLTVKLEVKTGDAPKRLKKIDESTGRVDKNLKKADKQAKKTGQSFKGMGKDAQSTGKKLSGLTGAIVGIAGTAIVAKVGGALLSLGGKALDLAMDYEQTTIAFNTMLGSAEKGKKILEDLEKFSLVTPFEPDEVIQAGKKMLAFGADADKIPDILKKIGDVSSGTGKDFNELALIYGKAMAKGKIDAETLNQLAEAGVPIIDTLAKVTGASSKEIFKMTSKGKIGFKELDQAFNQMTGTGGKFSNMMQKQSETAKGLLSTIAGYKDTIMRKFGEELLKVFKPLLKATVALLAPFTEWLKQGENMKKMVKFISILALTLIPVFIIVLYGLASALWATVAPTLILMLPLLKLIGIILLIGVAIGLLVAFWDDIVNFFVGLAGFVKDNYRWFLLLLGPIGLLINFFIELEKRFKVFSKIAGFFKGLFGGGEKKIVIEGKGEEKATRVGGSESVNDAIITKTGKVIKTHPDDNLIATKADPMSGGGAGGSNLTIENINITTMDANSLPGDLKNAVLKALNDLSSTFRAETVLA